MRLLELFEDVAFDSDLHYWEDQNTANFQVGKYDFQVVFHCYQSGCNRSWHVVGPRPAGGTGLFPRINEMLKKITLEWMAKNKPAKLRIYGEDEKRRSFNAANYGSWTPPGYRFVVKDSGVEFVRESVIESYWKYVDEFLTESMNDVWITDQGRFVAANAYSMTKAKTLPDEREILTRGWIHVWSDGISGSTRHINIKLMRSEVEPAAMQTLLKTLALYKGSPTIFNLNGRVTDNLDEILSALGQSRMAA